MANAPFPHFCPLGTISTVTPGTPVSLAVNSGPLAGGTGGTFEAPPVPGTALRQVLLTAASANTAPLFILPRGYTAAANPGYIMAAVLPGATIAFPPSGSQFGIMPENFVVDGTAAGTLYGCGFYF